MLKEDDVEITRSLGVVVGDAARGGRRRSRSTGWSGPSRERAELC